MPATPKKTTSPRKTPASPKKAKPPGPRQLQREWVESLPAPWVQVGLTNFAHPKDTWTVTKGDIKEKFPVLNDKDLQTLPYERRLSDAGFMMKLYASGQLTDLATRKCANLGKKLEDPNRLAAWQEHMLNPQPPPLKIESYTPPQAAATPDPEEICWTPSKISGSVTVDDACRLYCLKPDEISLLVEHSKWIDLATVAKLALTLHGGFYAHKELVLQRRNEEEEMLAREFSQADKRKSHFRFSPMISKQLKDNKRDTTGLYDIIGSTPPKHRVAVFYPIYYFSDDDYGCDWNWLPYWEDF